MIGILNKYFSGYAMEYGTWVGVSWVAVFALYVGGLRSQSVLMLMLAFVALLSLPVLTISLARRFRQTLAEDEQFGFGRAYLWSLVTLMYACLLTAAAEWAYFSFLDRGALLALFESMLNSPDMARSYEMMGMGQPLEEAKATLDLFRSLSPIDITLILLNQNIFVAMLLALPMALFARRTH